MRCMGEPELDDGLTVGAAAELLGVTVRTLHHWDEIGLAAPSVRTPAGYRCYVDADLQRLHRIVAYRELGLGLDEIRGVLDDAATEIGATLRGQRSRLAERIRDLREIDERLERMTEAHECGILLTDDEQSAAFGPDWDPRWTLQARVVWGSSPQWAQFAERSARRTQDEWRLVSEAIGALERDLGEAVDDGVLPGSPAANALAERHREVFSSSFFPLTRAMQVCLGRMFEADPAFAAHYDGVRAGLASWFRRTIDEAARARGIDPDAATWQ